MTNPVSPQVCPHSGKVGGKDQKLGPGPAAPFLDPCRNGSSVRGAAVVRNADAVGLQDLGMGHLWEGRQRYLQVQNHLPRARGSRCPQSGQKEGLCNIQDWATLRGGELPILGDVQSDHGGRYNGEVLRLWICLATWVFQDKGLPLSEPRFPDLQSGTIIPSRGQWTIMTLN